MAGSGFFVKSGGKGRKGRASCALLVVFLLAAGWANPRQAAATDLTGNGSASVSSGDSYDYVYGRYSSGGDAVASGSLVSVTGGSILMDLYGGSALSRNGDAEAMNNRVQVSGGLSGFNDNIYGGYARSYVGSAAADGNVVLLDGSLRFGPWVQVFGGYARMSGGTGSVEALNNAVSVGGSAALNFVVGGEAYGESSARASALAAGNAVSLNGGAAGLVYGGYAVAQGDAAALENTVLVSGGLFGDIVGGEVHSYAGSASAEGNVVTISGGSGTGNVVGASVQGDSGTASAAHNVVSLFHVDVGGSVSGGFAPESAVAANVNGNTVIVGRGAVVSGDAVGGAVTGTTSGSSADGNIVTVADGGLVEGDVIGGLVEAENSSASGNTVLIRNASVLGNVYGGDGGSGSTVTRNDVIIGEGATFSSTTSIFGGYAGGAPVTASGSGNVLFVDSWQGSVARVAGFENLHFVLPVPGAPVDVPMLTVTDAEADDFAGTVVTAQLPDVIAGGRAYLGDVFTLVSDESGAVGQASAGRLVSLLQGYATCFDGVLTNTGTAVQLQLTSVRMNPRIAALTEARAASAGLLNQGGDLVADGGFRSMLRQAESGEGEWTSFAAGHAGRSRHHTGSHADAEGFSGVTGLAERLAFDDGNVFFGGFFEFGRAHLSTFNGFASGDVRGRGSSQYTGLGMMVRLELNDGPLAGWHAEGAGRAGGIATDWRSGDLRDNMDRPAEYDLSQPYYGLQAGIGHELPLGDAVRADVYGRFFWTHQNGESADMNGERVDFDAVTSRRLRLGARLSWNALEGVTPYAGAAWEHEYDGTACAVARDFAVPDASLGGDVGIAEFGVSVEPASVPLALDLAFSASAGERDALGGHLSLMYRF